MSATTAVQTDFYRSVNLEDASPNPTKLSDKIYKSVEAMGQYATHILGTPKTPDPRFEGSVGRNLACYYSISYLAENIISIAVALAILGQRVILRGEDITCFVLMAEAMCVAFRHESKEKVYLDLAREVTQLQAEMDIRYKTQPALIRDLGHETFQNLVKDYNKLLGFQYPLARSIVFSSIALSSCFVLLAQSTGAITYVGLASLSLIVPPTVSLLSYVWNRIKGTEEKECARRVDYHVRCLLELTRPSPANVN